MTFVTEVGLLVRFICDRTSRIAFLQLLTILSDEEFRWAKLNHMSLGSPTLEDLRTDERAYHDARLFLRRDSHVVDLSNATCGFASWVRGGVSVDEAHDQRSLGRWETSP
jgi:hypothetical protein